MTTVNTLTISTDCWQGRHIGGDLKKTKGDIKVKNAKVAKRIYIHWSTTAGDGAFVSRRYRRLNLKILVGVKTILQ